jgi:hypothetical protein
MARPCALAEIGEQPLARARIGGRGEARAHALPGIRRERELGHQQEPAADVLEAPVHLPRDVRKDPIVEQTVYQAFGLDLGVPSLDGYQHEQPDADLGDGRVPDLDARLGYALQEAYHRLAPIIRRGG